MSWTLAFAGFAALIILHEFGHFIAAKAVGMRVERFALFFPPLLFKLRRGETEYGIGAIPLGGYVRITGMNPEEDIPPEVLHRAYYKQPVWKRIVVISAGPLMNVLIGYVLLVLFFVAIGARTGTPFVRSVEPNSPASKTLQNGDRLLSVDGKSGPAAVIAAGIGKHACASKKTAGCVAKTPVTLLVERDGQRATISAKPRYDAKLKTMRLGFGLDHERETIGFASAVTTGADRTYEISKAVLSLPARLFDERRKEISSVVGGYEVTRRTIIQDSGDAIGILAIISLSLAVINLFPFLPLDGGHIFWALVEKALNKPISVRVMEKASVVGFMLVMMLFIVGLTNDIERLQGEGFR